MDVTALLISSTQYGFTVDQPSTNPDREGALSTSSFPYWKDCICILSVRLIDAFLISG